MEYRKLGNLDVSVIGLGTLRTFDVADYAEIAVRRQIVDNCLDNDRKPDRHRRLVRRRRTGSG